MKIFFSDNLEKIKARIKSSGCIVSIFILNQGKKNEDIENKLRKIKNCEIINRTELEDKYKDKFKDEYIEFIKCINENRQPLTSPKESFPVTRVCLAMEEAVAQKKMINMSELT